MTPLEPFVGCTADENRSVIAANFRHARRQSGMRHVDVAELMAEAGHPWHPQTVSNVEGGRRRLVAEEIVTLSEIFGLPFAALLTPGPHSPAADHGQEESGAGIWTMEDVRALGVRTDLVTAASILGIGRTTAYELAQRGEFPAKLLRVGGQYMVLVTPLIRMLEGTDEEAPA